MEYRYVWFEDFANEPGLDGKKPMFTVCPGATKEFCTWVEVTVTGTALASEHQRPEWSKLSLDDLAVALGYAAVKKELANRRQFEEAPGHRLILAVHSGHVESLPDVFRHEVATLRGGYQLNLES